MVAAELEVVEVVKVEVEAQVVDIPYLTMRTKAATPIRHLRAHCKNTDVSRTCKHGGVTTGGRALCAYSSGVDANDLVCNASVFVIFIYKNNCASTRYINCRQS